jgi:hypothetical protein
MKIPGKYIAFHTQTRGVEAVGSAKEVIDELSEHFTYSEIEKEIEIYVLGDKLRLHVMLAKESEQ